MKKNTSLDKAQIDVLKAQLASLEWMYAFACNLLDERDMGLSAKDLREMEIHEIFEMFCRGYGNYRVVPD